MKRILLLLITGAGTAQLKPASFLDDIQQRLDDNAVLLKALHAKVSAPRAQVTAPKQQTKTVRFAPTIKVKKMRPKRTINLLLQHGFTKKGFKESGVYYPSTGLLYLKDKPNVSPKLIELLKSGHNLYVFKRNLRHIPTEEIIKSLESYLRCNRNAQLEEFLCVFKQGNYYEI